jgi:hypothetical protein
MMVSPNVTQFDRFAKSNAYQSLTALAGPPITQAAWAASHTRKTYLSSQYRRLAGRRGKKRAIIALAHTMLVMMYHLLRDGAEYKELGHDYMR